jgi:hypothetical protein
MQMKLEVTSYTENDDGSATVVFDMDNDTLHCFAKIGIMKALTEAVERTKEEHGEYKNDDNSGS